MVNQNRNRGFAHPILLAVLVVVIAAITWSAIVVHRNNQRHQAAISAERALYARLDTEAQKYIETINAKYPGEVKHTKTCSYTSTEVGTGALGCSVSTNLDYNSQDNAQAIFEYADSVRASLTWGKGEDVTQRNAKTFPGLEKDTLYMGDDEVSCTVSYYHSEHSLLISTDCSGPALAEHYPVKDK